ncbi:YbdK family carboxylate-amine ligase [Streptomyces sp. SP18ES09]|uniref:carboxylate-amine ligase n=1 Tax=Streptomyces sp. SP18ES09 TaxID=3002532 RepID=UPI002E789576|nr:YbdK family carboxylate-amine ligase [Streptomyces sp. SP18ES09]MEE1816110.1 YbdK family carboxylate-amine ligase [Streptomyces sp. SP18ES09]
MTSSASSAPLSPDVATLGVEEEFFLADPHTRLVVPAGPAVAARAAAEVGDLVTKEFALGQVEGRTPPCRTGTELRGHLKEVRAALVGAARAEGVHLYASGTPVLQAPGPVEVADHPRYQAAGRQYRSMMDDFAVSALHVHVHLTDRELAVWTVNRLRPWLPLLIAMSANSPFHRGEDTGYAGFRTVLRSRFPCLGPPPYARTLQEHERLAAAISDSEAMLDPETAYWDLRPHPRLPTLEIRAMDVLPDVEDTVAVALLLRALVATLTAQSSAHGPGPAREAEVLRAACWRAARDGWAGTCFDPATGRYRPVADLAADTVSLLRPALEQTGDMKEVTGWFGRLADRGDAAARQRAWGTQLGGPEAVVDRLVLATACGRGA